MVLTITISDPETVALLCRYEQYVDQVDGVLGTIDQLAEGLMLGSLDQHQRFWQWSNANAEEVAA